MTRILSSSLENSLSVRQRFASQRCYLMRHRLVIWHGTIPGVLRPRRDTLALPTFLDSLENWTIFEKPVGCLGHRSRWTTRLNSTDMETLSTPVNNYNRLPSKAETLKALLLIVLPEFFNLLSVCHSIGRYTVFIVLTWSSFI